MVNITELILQYKYIIIFYLVVAILVFTHRKKIDFQAKIIMLYRTSWGLKFIKTCATKFREWVILFGYLSTGLGIIGLFMISFILIQNIYKLLFVAGAANGVALVLPGINIPGLGVLPFWHWLIAIFVIATVHEFSHGVVAKAHNIKVKSTGLVLIGPIIGAFVEPDEKTMDKKSDIIQYSVLAAGPISNVVLALIAILVLNLCVMPIQNSMLEEQGFVFEDYIEGGYPAELSGLPLNTPITAINNQETINFAEFADVLQCTSPGDTIIVTTTTDEGTSTDYNLTLADNPENPGKSFMGISIISNEVDVKPELSTGSSLVLYNTLDWVRNFLKWLFLLSFGIGLFNLLPLPIVDGGKMTQIFLHKWRGKVKGEETYHRISMVFLLILLFSLLFPLFKTMLGWVF
ncbi:site-2 protease family protein [archaeon]|jgi:membrane-associated protease RseP (regulator of RpoE activity)|nr:site-2 protease family protein [archaeon]MBT6762170.1 site-2 protease family protein [archaeon]